MSEAHPTGFDEVHLATVSFEGRFWDAYVVFDESVAHPRTSRASVRFSAPESSQGSQPTDIRTSVIFVEPNQDEVLRRARTFGEHQLIALLRSALPD